ncbi:MAG: TonB-dependent receptor [Gemmatimonadaceae bacterium]
MHSTILQIWSARISLGLALLTAGTAISAQEQHTTVRGVVRSLSGPVRGANVFVLETLDGVLTDSAGTFAVRTAYPFPLTLHVKRIGFAAHQRVVSDSAFVTITLQRTAALLAPITVQAGTYTAGTERGATLTPLEVVTTPGTSADINRAIQLLPGVQAVDDGTALFVRGGDYTETKAYLNEAPLLNPVQLLTPSGTFVGTVDPFQLDGIFFSSGGFGARYGDALSAVVGLRTRGVAERAAATLGAGLAAWSGDVAVPVSSVTIRVAGNRFDLEPFFRVNGPTRSFTPPPHGHDVSGSTTWAYRPGSEVKLFALGQTNVVGVDLDEPSFSGTFDSDIAARLIVLNWRDVFGAIAPLVSVSESRLTRHERYGAFALDALQRQRQLHAQAAWEATGKLVIRGGGEIVRLTSDLAGSLPRAAYDPGNDARVNLFALVQSGSRHGVFLEADWRAHEALRLTSGVRSDRSNLTHRTTLDPRLSVAWRLAGSLTLTGALGVYHQVPDPIFFADSSAGTNLLPMRSRQAVVGLQAGEGPVMFRIEAYHKRYDELVQQTRNYQVVRGGRGTSRGVDIFYKGRLPMGGLELRSIASFLVARRSDPETGRSVRAPFDVSATQSATVERAFGNGVRLAATYRSATGKPFTPILGATYDPTRDIYVPRYGAAMSERFPGLRRVDISASRFRALTRSLASVLYLSLSNVLDRENVQSWRYSRDYSERVAVRSIFNRSLYFGASLIWQ